MAESLLMDRNFVSGVCNLKPKNINLNFSVKQTYVFTSPG